MLVMCIVALILFAFVTLPGCAYSLFGQVASSGASYTYASKQFRVDGKPMSECSVQITSAREVTGGAIKIDKACALTSAADGAAVLIRGRTRPAFTYETCNFYTDYRKGSLMAEILIKAIDFTHPDPDIDRVGSYKKGMIVFVKDDGYIWGRKQSKQQWLADGRAEI